MKSIQIIIFILSIGFLTITTAQESVIEPVNFEKSFTEQTSEQEKFAIYLDTLDKYLYRDVDISNFTIKQCEKIIDQKIPLPDSTLFKFILEKIYHKHNLADPVGAYEIILNYENKLDKLQISPSKIGNFSYIKGFTYMALGDLEAAQKSYYQNIERAKTLNNSGNILSSLYSLGQLYSDHGDHLSAIQSYEKTLDISKKIEVRPSTLTLIHLELSESLHALKKEDQALEALDIAYKIASDNKLEILKTEILIKKGSYYIKYGNENKAKEIHEQILTECNNIKDHNNKISKNYFLADLYRMQKKYQLSLAMQEKNLEQIDTSNYDQVMKAYDQLQQTSYEMQDHQLAYDYLLTHNKIKEKTEKDKRKQKTNYLKIKFNSKEKERENVILAAQIVESKNQSKILFLSLALSGLVMFLLIGAFYQKNRYSKRLETEVSKRTQHLKQTNNELKEFNRILSHDLKEPIRSIVGFSQLATRQNLEADKLKEYLSFVISGGKQLQDLISSVSKLRQVDAINFTQFELVDLSKTFKEIIESTQQNHPDIEIDFQDDTQVSILTVKDPIESILKILIDNAVKYNQNQKVKIQVEYGLKDNTHFIKIKDNGIGIDEEYHEKVFEMFRKLNNQSEFKGSGMGLSIAEKLVKRMDGTISILDSKKQTGSTFLITLPVKESSNKQEKRLTKMFQPS